MTVLAQAAAAPVPGWAWVALLGLVGALGALAAWALRQLFEDLRASIRAVREQLLHVEAKVDAVRDEMHDTIPALRTDVAQARAIQVGNNRRLLVLEAQAEKRGALREVDLELLSRWGKDPEG